MFGIWNQFMTSGWTKYFISNQKVFIFIFLYIKGLGIFLLHLDKFGIFDTFLDIYYLCV